MTAGTWDAEYDVVVIGAGAGGMAAALTAKIEGLDVLLVEKTDRVGGSTAVSGGAVWAPLNAQSEKVGHPDSFDKVWTYMRNTVGDAAPAALQQAFLREGAGMVDYLEKHTAVRLVARSFSPDYYPDREGAAMGGRSLDPAMFDGRELGPKFKELRDPLPEFMVLGGMMITMTDAKHLLAVTKSFKSWREGMKLVLRYFADRLRGYHRGTRLVLGNALAGRLFMSVLERGIDYWLNAPLKTLQVEDGRVTGACIEHEGRPTWVRARQAVVVAHEGAAGTQLIAYGVAEAGQQVEVQALREALAAQLPAFMVPAQIILLPRLPLNANGDRVGGAFAWFNRYAVLGGLAVVGFSLVHAGLFLMLKTDGEIRYRARAFVVRFAPVLLLPIVGWVLVVQFRNDKVVTWPLILLAVIAAATSWVMARQGREFVAFGGLGVFRVVGVRRR